jgi:tetratricopeptide (TPR) repeat protein
MPFSESQPPTISPARRRLFFILMLLAPALFFVLLELILRLIQYGPNLSLFVTETIHGKNYCTMNPEVKGRYFYMIDFNPSTSPDYFALPKPPGTYRIFCLGASTTVGYPYWFNGSFSTFLRDRLRAVFPKRPIEVINLGMTATNSYTAADIARELPAYQPDCIIVYDGHNEFYGGLGVASRESIGQSRWLNRLYLRLVRFRTFVLMRDIVSAAMGLFHERDEDLPPATMMERLSRGQYVPFDGALYHRGLEVFRENLCELRDVCADAGVPLILSTQVSNIRRQPPFVSKGDPGATPNELLNFNLTLNRGITDYLNGDFVSALGQMRGIAGPETLRADLHFQIARCLDTLSRDDEARREYVMARDLDQLRFRASSDINSAIRSMEDGRRVFVADIEKLFALSSPDSLIGTEFIVDHLHPNLKGYFMIAREYARILRAHELVADAPAWRVADTLSEARLWDERCATRLDEMICAQKTAVLTSGWPFRDQPPTVPSVLPTDTLGQIVELYMRDQISWAGAHMEAAAYYASRGEVGEAAREYLTIAEEMPFDTSPLIELGQLYLGAHQTDNARLAFQRSLGRDETSGGYAGLGKVRLYEGAVGDAALCFERALRLARTPEERAESEYQLALLHLRWGDRQRAVQELREAVKAMPSHRQAAELLSRTANGQ